VSQSNQAIGFGNRQARVRFIDAGRGSAMLFVLLSHFLEGFFPNPNGFHIFLGDVTEVASPTFVLISGALVGFLYRVRPDAFAQLRVKLIDRGLFLLTVGHLLLLGGHYAMTPTFRWLPITDAVGFSMLVSPWIVTRTRSSSRLLFSAGLYATTWLVVAFWYPASAGEIIKETIFGSLKPTFYAYVFPLLPWVSVDLAATVLGEYIAVLHVRGNHDAIGALLNRLWIGGVSSGLALAVALKGVSTLWPVASGKFAEVVYGVRALHTRIPPGPVYLLFYGGLGMLLLRLCFIAERRTGNRVASVFVKYASAIGQSSLFTYVWQYYVYYTGLHLIRASLPFQWAWPAYFGLTAVVVLGPALWWQRAGYNRFITVGYPYLVGSQTPPMIRKADTAYGTDATVKRSVAS
jgi:uncharacterized membrane protein